MQHKVLFFLNIEGLRTHELLIEVAGMLLKSDFLNKVFVLRSMGNELVPSHLKGEGRPIHLRERIHNLLTINK